MKRLVPSLLLLLMLIMTACGRPSAGPAVDPSQGAPGAQESPGENGGTPGTNGGGPGSNQGSPGDGSSGPGNSNPGNADPSTPAPEPPAPTKEVTLTFVGDLMLTRIPGQYIARGEDPFADFAQILTGADLTIGNLECVIATVGEAVPKAYNFRCDPHNVPLLAKYFDAVSVANNHSGDYGKEAFAEQLQLLKAGGLPYFGGGMNHAEAHSPLILERNGLRIALLGYNEVELQSYAAGPESPGLAWSDTEQVEADIRAAREQADLVIVYPHWGYEYQPYHSERQHELARRMIDAGADLVIGSHPHVTQPVELYKDRLIAYSLGNYVFDDFMDVPPSLDEPSRTSWVLRVKVGKDGLIGWESLVARTDDRGFPQWLKELSAPCSTGAAEQGFLCTPESRPEL